MFEYFYNEILRRTIISFGTLFNGITVKQEDSTIKVPLAYGPTQKFLARLEQTPDLNKSTAITLPRMSFEFTGLTYDPSRKVTTTQTFTVKDPTTGKDSKKAYLPVPYNMQFELAIMCKLNDDALQITEQILPYFQPAYNVTVTLVESIKEKRDIPIVLENITMQDDYEGDFTQRRVLLYTLRFTAKTYLFGPVSDASKDIIKKSTVNYRGGKALPGQRDVTYSVAPRAIKNYTGDVVTNLASDILINDIVIPVENASNISASTNTTRVFITIGEEEMKVIKKDGNNLTVERGRDGTTPASHLRGDAIGLITDADDVLIPEGDDFGFDGSTF
jgi:hypothetical protein|tara:strand:+ start:1189 stop:2184 length:996 start_codon:yes stop_codon:yes gene_type:complete